MKQYPSKSTLLFYFISMFFLGSLLYGTVEITVLKVNPNMEKHMLDILVNSILQFLIYFIIFIGIIILMKEFYKDEFKDFKQKALKIILFAVIAWISTYAILIVYNIILTIIKYNPSVPENQQAIEETFFSYPYLIFPVLVIGAPFIEETIFRGVIFRTIYNSRLPQKVSLIIAFIVSSGIFGLIHVLLAFLISKDIRDIIDGIPYFISGFILTFVYYKTKNIYAPMITHFLHNTAATLLLLLSLLLKDFLPEEVTTSTIHIVLKFLHLQ